MENFTLFPYPDPDPYPDRITLDERNFFKKYSIIPKELYDVTKKFEIAPSSLNQNDKNLRKQYIEIMTKVLENEGQNIKSMVAKTEPDPIVLANVDDAIIFARRVAKLLLSEIDPVVCEKCVKEVCPEPPNTPYYYIFFLVVVILFLIYKLRYPTV